MPVIIVLHHPYRIRGGEDVHVEALAETYTELGYQTIVSPVSGHYVSESPKSMWDGIYSESMPEELVQQLTRFPKAIVHIHNIHPIPGAAVLRYLKDSTHRVLATIHNHRMYCTNGLATYRGKVCYDCRESLSLWRPIVKNCNSDLKRSVYYSLSLHQLRSKNLWRDSVDRFIAPSPYIANEIECQGISADKISIVPHSVTIPREILGENPAEEGADFVYFGRISEEKGIREIVDIAEECEDIRFQVMGDGPLAPWLRSKSLKNLNFLEGVDRDFALTEAKKARFALSLSRCNESFSMWPLEAAILGLPSLVSDMEYTTWMREANLPVRFVDSSNLQKVIGCIRELKESTDPIDTRSDQLQTQFGAKRFSQSMQTILESL